MCGLLLIDIKTEQDDKGDTTMSIPDKSKKGRGRERTVPISSGTSEYDRGGEQTPHPIDTALRRLFVT